MLFFLGPLIRGKEKMGNELLLMTSESLKIINCLGLKLEKISMILLNLDSSESFRDTRRRNVTKSFRGLILVIFP